MSSKMSEMQQEASDKIGDFLGKTNDNQGEMGGASRTRSRTSSKSRSTG
jgi:hypothetical protein